MHLIASLALAACSGEGSGGTPPPLDPGLELGTGEVEFEPLTDGDDVWIVFGPQGGYHFTVSMRAQGIDPGDNQNLDAPDNPTMTFRALVDGEQLGDETTYVQGIDPVVDEPGVYQMIGRRLFLDILDDAELTGVEVLLEVDLVDHQGIALHDERTIVGVPSPFN